MKVYTRKGDTGETSLIGGTRVKKYNLRIEAYGTVDELNSFIGLIRDTAEASDQDALLMDIQNRLFTIGSELASDPENSRMKVPELQPADIEALEKAIDKMDEQLEPLKNFILPGGDLAASYCHVARCVCRRAERRVIELNEQAAVDPKIMKYLNRLSDYLFVVARYFTRQHGGVETLWKTRT
ncbi:MAG TPA: cob(I)yrinic acid a,c-diamide adenosyltransferase [Cryomorphaceae bacterium]|nr:ATP:cob(I)alamin adenosyltransferase [Owenweeksia sp.]MBF99249.1 ATP:cob(I)alamin adenosyltransferase [Owenweeksia sp.]HAD97939.1 cob(I)yrinic acid a,c-diamide adenosyltransferase [Cryomorphaceae bacterium]HBF20697.1 cob(I)yrinic acid a,c-diamide adenosyltransferase [Cryomorphaceae bacterium]HCQ16681.1 cob(I)yrinic acid a,c-diamide adenosyltransferase [Cryomorphaceae bacterium]